MSKRRKCRYSAEELAVHEEAVRLRKLTDKQLVEEFRRVAEAAEMAVRVPEAAQAASGEADPNENTSTVQKLISALSEGKCKGVKGATVYKITEFATEMGLI
jgi:hypothetical protein